MSEIRIEMTGHGRGKVFVDGVELPGVNSVGLRFRNGTPNIVHVQLLADRVTVTGPAIVVEHEVKADG